MTITLPMPSDIDASRHMFDSFGQSESEVSAGYIVRYMQEREEAGEIWPSFTYEQIDDFYTRKGAGNGFTFNRLLGYQRTTTDYLIVNPDGSFLVTLTFIANCFRSSPRV